MSKKEIPMKVRVVGGGGAFATMEQGNSAFLIDIPGHRVLIDCGTTVPYVLRDEWGIPLGSITDIVITHAHGDHIAGLELLLYSNKYLGTNPKPALHTPGAVWQQLKQALTPGLAYSKDQLLTVEDFFSSVTHNGGFIGGIPLRFQPAEHCGEMPATSLRIGNLFISGDINAPAKCIHPSITTWFHEAEFGFATGVHCPVAALIEAFPPGVRSKMWLYHCPAGTQSKGGFAGVLRKDSKFLFKYLPPL